MIAIIDYNIGNLGAVANMFTRIGANCVITCDPAIIRQASGIVLPGNGSFDACMEAFLNSGLQAAVEQQVMVAGIPLLGICVGAQMLGISSEEGKLAGLGWLKVKTRRFPEIQDLRVPHMGWTNVKVRKFSDPLCKALDQKARFYFVHSFYLEPLDEEDVLFEAYYGIDFAAAVSHNNIWGVQFHPEKSHRFGKQLLAAFADVC